MSRTTDEQICPDLRKHGKIEARQAVPGRTGLALTPTRMHREEAHFMLSTPELWRPITGYEGRYEVSNHGRVRSIARIEQRKDGRRHPVRETILSPGSAKRTGHLQVALRAKNQSKTFQVHQLVARAFLPEPVSPELIVCHYDDDVNNNHVGNLRWDTRSANNYDAVRNGRHHKSRRSECPRGHRLAGSNIQDPRSGIRRCRACHIAHKRVSRNPYLDLQFVSDAIFADLMDVAA